MPGGYKHEHITHYTLDRSARSSPAHGIAIEETAYIMRSQLILRCRKAELEDRTRSEVAAVASTAA